MRRRLRRGWRRFRNRVRRRAKIIIPVPAILVALGVLVYFLWPGPNLRVGSVQLGDVDIRISSRIVEAYRIVYRVEAHAAGDVLVSTEDVLVRRPFEARSESRTGPPPGNRPQGLTVNVLGRLKTERLVLATPPAPATFDQRVDAFLPEAEEAGYAEQREARRVAGRRCRVYRLAGSPGAPSLARIANLKDTWTDLCVDEAGLIMEEVGVIDGKMLTRRLATRIDEDPEIDRRTFQAGDPTLPVRQGGGSVRRLTLESRPPGTFWEFRDDPKGFRHDGRYSIVPPQTGFDDPMQRQGIVAFMSDVWLDGIDVIIVEQGATLGGRAPFAREPEAVDVRVGALGSGQVVYGSGHAEVRVLLGGGRFVRVVGTVAPSRLLAAARSLERQAGGRLVYLDEATGEVRRDENASR